MTINLKWFYVSCSEQAEYIEINPYVKLLIAGTSLNNVYTIHFSYEIQNRIDYILHLNTLCH